VVDVGGEPGRVEIDGGVALRQLGTGRPLRLRRGRRIVVAAGGGKQGQHRDGCGTAGSEDGGTGRSRRQHGAIVGSCR
jgi:hypothetical protein